MKRRSLLHGALAWPLAALAGALSRSARAAWQADAFDARSIGEALKACFGTDDHMASGDLQIKAPALAENGAMVPVEISTNIPGIETLSIFVEGNQNPLAATFQLGDNPGRVLATRVKLGRSSGVTVVARAGGRLYSARKDIQVTIGGCGG